MRDPLYIELPSPALRWTLVGAVCVLCAWFAWKTARFAWAQQQIQSQDIASVESALRQQAFNPGLHDHLGVLLSYVDIGRIGDAVKEVQTATRINPRVPWYWADLGRVCFVAGDHVCARQAFAAAVQAAPMTPEYQRDAAMFLLATGDPHDAMHYLRRYLQLQPEDSAALLNVILPRFDSPAALWDGLLGDSSDQVKLAFVNVLESRGQHDDAIRFWTATVASGAKFTCEQAGTYLVNLQQRNELDNLASAWRDLQRMGNNPRADEDNLVYNGSFAYPLCPLGLNWEFTPAPFLHTEIERGEEAAMPSALHVSYTFPHNDWSEATAQLLAVQPNTRYELTAMVRSVGVTSDSGPVLRVMDVLCPSCLDVHTESTTGTTPWHEQKLTFSTSSSSRFVRLSVWRVRSRTFPMENTGDYWITAVRIHDVGAIEN